MTNENDRPEATLVGKSILAGINAFTGDYVRRGLLAQPVRASTLDWLADVLSAEVGVSRGVARTYLIDAIPRGCENILDEGCEFMFIVDEAALAMGLDPNKIDLTPALLNS